MIVHGRVVAARRACRSRATAAGSRYSAWYFIGPPGLQLFQVARAGEEGEDSLCFVLVDDRQGEADVHDDVHTGLSLGHVLQADALADAAEIDLPHPQVVFKV